MLKELSKYENLGTPSSHYQLLRRLCYSQEEKLFVKHVSELFYNRIIDNRSVFDGCLPLLQSVGIVEINSSEEVILNGTFRKYLESEAQMVDKLVERLLLSANSDPIFHDMFCSEYISYDIIYRSVQIDNSAFPLKYSCFKQLLIDFNILQAHPTKNFNKYIVNGRYKKIFDKVVLPEIKKRKIGIEELRKSLEQNQIYGEEAEKFVLEFEKIRLNRREEIDWVAEYSITDGYDIASYETEDSNEHDRFIEVKSYNIEPYFFWSRNEIDIARIKRNSYYLYLVDRSKMIFPDYVPIIIRDPYENVLKNNSEWEQRIEKIRFQKMLIL
ncbi:MAG TPA: DUF3883 domain-containing protein [Edaphocola sp.]|nr:DUF3883 domain-containing protein [Edaphocola sp.]